MIRLQSIPKPKELTQDFIQQGVQTFLTNQQDVWNAKFLRTAILDKSFSKCSYCETLLNEESKYLEVDHFHPKQLYPQEVLNWENLLPSCKRCNTKKGSHDTKNEPIINPEQNDPQKNLYFKAYRFYGKTSLGKTSIHVINLNDRDRLGTKRFKVGQAIISELETLLELAEDYESKTHRNTRRKNLILNKLEALMRQGTPNEEYSATVATVLLSEPTYTEIKSILNKQLLWSKELTDLEKQLHDCSLAEPN